MKAVIPICLSLIFWTHQASGHHSFSASFTEDIIQAEGVVSRFVFRNPHVTIYMDVTDDAGNEVRWMVEGGAANLLRQAGWTNDSIQPGETLRVTGRSGRDGRPMIQMGALEILDPETRVVLRTPSLDRSGYDPGAGGIASIPLRLADGRPNLTGAWVMSGGGMGGMGMGARNDTPLNEAGAALQAQWDPANDPQVACEDPSLVRQAGFTPHPVRVTQNDDHVVIAYEEYGGVRAIYFDDRAYSDGSDDLIKLGRSQARYEDDSLIVESTHIPAGPTGPQGNWLSDQTTTVETYRRDDDPALGPMLAMEMIVSDPGHLTGPWAMSWRKRYLAGYEFIPVDCQTPL